jgi:Ni2+-binding GTPase involved in maturation of urease and hydrogenase
MSSIALDNTSTEVGAGGDQPPLVVGIGGFLGAGKTTAILQAARALSERGQRVAIVTNDQASDLVDTALARTVSDTVAEIPGGCFCCRFDRLEETLGDLMAEAQPDIILAEAVGSCTDLAATVYQPLRQRATTPVRLGPLTVVADGRRLYDTMRSSTATAASSAVTYLYERQLAEADLLLLNKVDLLTADERAWTEATLAAMYPGVPVLRVAAVNGEGIAAWLERLVDTPRAGARVLDLDYDRYADAEASLGWLNLEASLTLGEAPVARWVTAVLEGIRRRADDAGAALAHVKLWVEPTGERAPAGAGDATRRSGSGRARGSGGAAGQAHPAGAGASGGAGIPWTIQSAGEAASAGGPQMGIAGGSVVANARPAIVWSRGEPGSEARVVLNARVAAVPDTLAGWVQAVLDEAGDALGARATVIRHSAFSPARPVPLFRLLPVN